jgi:kynurenine formamidase
VSEERALERLRADIVDLSHAIDPSVRTYPGLPLPAIAVHLTREASRSANGGRSEFQIDSIAMVGNTGTYLDSPFHRYATGRDISTIDLARHANLKGVVVSVGDDVRAITPDLLPEDLPTGGAVLFRTSWDRRWGTGEYGVDSPYLHERTAVSLVKAGIFIAGIDSVNIDNMRDLSRPVHTILLEANIGIVEHLCNLKALTNKAFRFFAVPPAVRGMGSFPVRAFAIVQ